MSCPAGSKPICIRNLTESFAGYMPGPEPRTEAHYTFSVGDWFLLAVAMAVITMGILLYLTIRRMHKEEIIFHSRSGSMSERVHKSCSDDEQEVAPDNLESDDLDQMKQIDTEESPPAHQVYPSE